jgi:hypothetical protein
MSHQEDDEIEILKCQLRAAEQRASVAEQRAEEERQEREATEKRLAEEKEQSENTTFPKFLELCHNHLSLPLKVQTDLSLTTGGSTTRPNGRKHPTYLRPWEDFPQLHQHYFDQAYKLLCPDNPPKLFTPRIVIENLGPKLCRRPLASEPDVQSYERLAVEEMVREVMEQLMKMKTPEAL